MEPAPYKEPAAEQSMVAEIEWYVSDQSPISPLFRPATIEPTPRQALSASVMAGMMLGKRDA